jgi:hypothetical protein
VHLNFSTVAIDVKNIVLDSHQYFCILTIRFEQLGTHLRGKKKREEMGNLLRKKK